MFDRIILGAAAAIAPLTAVEAAQPPAPPASIRTPGEPPAAVSQLPVDPAKLAAAERLMAAIWPDDLLIEAISAAMAEWTEPQEGNAGNDPHRAERLRLTQQATVSEFGRLIGEFAPEFRRLSARFYARRLSISELDEAARFYSSPAGRRMITGSLAMVGHANVLQGVTPPAPDPELVADFVRLAQRIATETAHLQPPPAPPTKQSRAERREAKRAAKAERRRAGNRKNPDKEELDELADAVATADSAPAAPPADPARLAAARRAASAMWPDEAFAQPLPLGDLAKAVSDLPVSAFAPAVPLPGGLGPHASLGQLLATYDRNLPEGVLIVSRILSEELPRLLPRAAPLFRQGISELYAREFSVAELDAMSEFHESLPGRAFARESFTALADPEFVRGSLLMVPRLVVEGLSSMLRIGQVTAHLPPPPPPPPSDPAGTAPGKGGETNDDRPESGSAQPGS